MLGLPRTRPVDEFLSLAISDHTDQKKIGGFCQNLLVTFVIASLRRTMSRDLSNFFVTIFALTPTDNVTCRGGPSVNKKYLYIIEQF